MRDEIKTTKTANVADLFDFIKAHCDGAQRIETIAWRYEQDYEDVTTYLDYGDEDLFVSLHEGKLRVIMGESARMQYVKNMEELQNRKQIEEAKEAQERERLIAEARATLKRFNVGLTDKEVQ